MCRVKVSKFVDFEGVENEFLNSDYENLFSEHEKIQID